jgi:3-oxoacyl-[acyl-carrier protein] reductase
MAIDDGVLSGKAAVVTGGSRGIGRAIVERLARDGAQVVFGYVRNAEAAADVERTVAETGGTAHAVQADLGEPDGVARLFEHAEKHLDGLDILVNNAAGDFRPALLVDVTEEYYEQLMAVNVRAPFLALQYAARHLRDGGRIVNISTLNTVLAGPGISVYAGSKGALEQFTAVAAHELGPRGITVNTVSPGATETDLLRSTNSSQSLEAFTRLTPLGRIGQPADVADVVAFLVGPDGRWMTGQNLRAAGGIR